MKPCLVKKMMIVLVTLLEKFLIILLLLSNGCNAMLVLEKVVGVLEKCFLLLPILFFAFLFYGVVIIEVASLSSLFVLTPKKKPPKQHHSLQLSQHGILKTQNCIV